MSNRPSGTVTFLFTDIEGSTQLWETRPDWMARAHTRQESILRHAFAGHGGYPYKMIGDAFQVAFASAPAALAAAVDAQRALHSEAWGDAEIRVRMGLHSGETEERDDDYVGPLLNRAARLMSAGHGGQILVSQSARELLPERLPDGIALTDLGERRLKDLIRKERVYQVVGQGLPREFPALKTLDARPHNLPVQATHFIGREQEIGDIGRALERHRLVTLIGAGGSGKTRLSLHVASEVLDTFADGVWFVELAPVGDERGVPQAVASVMGAPEQPGTPVLEGLVNHVRERQLLIVLDNCEHVLGAAAALAKRLVEAAARVRILATSREPLRLSGESTFRVPSLEAPDPNRTAPIGDLQRFPSVRLFVDRAVSVSPSFTVTASNAAAIAEICHRLDGIPLAIELAAVRVRSLNVERIAERLSDRFRLLTGGDRTSLPRQQTLRGLIDWSYELLTVPERTLLQRISVFAGSFALGAAEHVGADGPAERNDVLERLTELVEKSMVSIDPESGRYRLLETVREYALAHLRAAGGEDAARERHLDCYLAIAEQADPELMGPEQGAWIARLDVERENLLAAHAFCGASEHYAERGLRLVLALRNYWLSRALLEQGHRITIEALSRRGAASRTVVRCRALFGAGRLSSCLERYDEARDLATESLSIAREIGDGARAAGALLELGLVAHGQGDRAAARAHYEEALELGRQLDKKRLLSGALTSLAELHREAGEWERAEPLYEQSLALDREMGDRSNVAICLLNLAMVLVGRGELVRARAAVLEALSIAEQTGSRFCGQMALDVCAGLAAVAGRWEDAAGLYAAVELQRERTGMQREPADQAFIAPLMALTRESLGDARYREATVQSRTRTYEEALKTARAWLEASAPRTAV